MFDDSNAGSIDFLLQEIRKKFLECAPDILPLYDMYAAEAAFGRRYISNNLQGLSRRAKILEVGAGSLLLSCQLVREGFEVTSLDPIGSGFSHFSRMRQIVFEWADSHGCRPNIANLRAEDLSETEFFDFAFSVNVMEHVTDFRQVLQNVARSLVIGGVYRFTCPNYLFPYEPHFNIPTLFHKKITEKFLADKIFQNERLPDPAGTWESINWITIPELKRCLKEIRWVSATFDKSMVVSTLERVASDPSFSTRRSPVMSRFIHMLVRLKLHRLSRYVPYSFHPIIDCSIERHNQLT